MYVYTLSNDSNRESTVSVLWSTYMYMYAILHLVCNAYHTCMIGVHCMLHDLEMAWCTADGNYEGYVFFIMFSEGIS